MCVCGNAYITITQSPPSPPHQNTKTQYFNLMLEGVKPRPEPLLLRRVIMNTIPRFGAPPAPAAVGGWPVGMSVVCVLTFSVCD